jgi:2-polyprenyl-6-methoxyphenol hydroxylase-like FAD-dependent oxidoreductase
MKNQFAYKRFEGEMGEKLTGTQVLIIGAGPAGLSLAAELRRLAVEPVIVDQQAAGANTSRACVIHARTLEVLEPLGVTKELLAQGEVVPFFRARDRDRILIALDFSRIHSKYNLTLMCPQDRTEQILLDSLERQGARVIRPAQFRRMTQGPDGNGVRADLDCADGPRSITAQWLVGCDGMNSAVRDQSGIPFVGARYDESFVLADVKMSWPLSRDEVTLFFSHEGFMVVSPLPNGQFRIVATVDEAPEVPSMAFVQALLDSRGPKRQRAVLAGIIWGSRFRVHHRVAASPRKGRVLLCGDAAHVHSPAGGQGMNTGIQDSIALADALAQTLKDGNEKRIDEWAVDRHKIATSVVALTDRMTRVATLKSSVGKGIRNQLLSLIGRLPPVRAFLAKNLAELR